MELIPIWWNSFSSLVTGRAGYKFQTKLQLLKGALKHWSTTRPENYTKNKNSLLQIIQSLDVLEETKPLTEQEATLRSSTRLDYFTNFKKEELFWYQRSRVKWLKAGDLDTGFFHRIANCRRRDNSIFTPKKDNAILTRAEDIEVAIIEYFQHLYTAPQIRRPRRTSLEFRSLSDQSKLWIQRPFSKNEILAAINNLANDKAPGPNGFPIAPFKTL
ncbi:hypothetical protein AMTRI_Chr12g271450 [Amborella trichopoda]